MTEETKQPTGPRGGTTTVTASGLVKKNLWVPEEMAEALRVKSYEERRTEADIMREALRRWFDRNEGREASP